MTFRLGIDLGTTYTAAAVHREDKASIFPLGGRAAAIPSVVHLREDETVLTGEAAVRRAITEPDRVAREFKRRLGDTTPIIVGGTPYSAEALMARILKYVMAEVSKREGGDPDHIAISHPANWGPYKIDLLHQGIRRAGIDPDIVSLLTEPEAAAISYAQSERVDPGEIVAVYDLGGGTFDAAVLRKTDAGFEILGRPEGIERMGGIDFDAALFAHVNRTIGDSVRELDPDDPASIAAVARLRQDCVDAKEALSSDTDASIPVMLPNLQTEIRITRAEFEGLIRPVLADSIDSMRRAVDSAKISLDDVSRILLVGGSSRIPLVSQLVASELGRPTAVDAHPKHAVAVGAAYHAAVVATDGAAAASEPANQPVVPPAAPVAPVAEAAAPPAPPAPAPAAAPEAPAPAASPPPAAEAPTEAPPSPAPVKPVATPPKPAPSTPRVETPAPRPAPAPAPAPAATKPAAQKAAPAAAATVAPPARSESATPGTAAVGAGASASSSSSSSSGGGGGGKTMVLVAGGLIGLIAIVGGAIALTGGGGDETTATTVEQAPTTAVIEETTTTTEATTTTTEPPPDPVADADVSALITGLDPVQNEVEFAIEENTVTLTGVLIDEATRDGLVADLEGLEAAPEVIVDEVAVLPEDERCTELIRSQPEWACLTGATLDANGVVRAEYETMVSTGQLSVASGFHLHLFSGNIDPATAGTAGAASVGGGGWQVWDQDTIETAGANIYGGTVPEKICVRIANSSHQLVSLDSGQCILLETAEA